ncbi:MAG: PIG-L deacetylase family protein [Thermomicrobiales bacterium]|jgi:LmbE family N-acetylglucosaminyl deacetylase
MTDEEQQMGLSEDAERVDGQSEIDLSTKALAPTRPEEMPKRALVIVAHPDDAEFSCGATAAKWSRDGWDVRYVIVTDASGGGDDNATDVGPEARKAISDRRKAEQREAARVAGVAGVDFLDQRDGTIEPTLALRREIVRCIRRHKPSIIVCPSPEYRWDPFYIGRHHPDHLAVGQAVIAAIYPSARNAWDFPELLEEGLLPHRVKELWVVGAPNTNHFVNVSETVDVKIEALRAHDSQLGAHFDEVAKNVRSGLQLNGSKYGVSAAEEFYRAGVG